MEIPKARSLIITRTKSGKEYNGRSDIYHNDQIPIFRPEGRDNTGQYEPVWVIMAVVIGCIAVAAGVIIVRKIHLKKQDEEDTE